MRYPGKNTQIVTNVKRYPGKNTNRNQRDEVPGEKCTDLNQKDEVPGEKHTNRNQKGGGTRGKIHIIDRNQNVRDRVYPHSFAGFEPYLITLLIKAI